MSTPDNGPRLASKYPTYEEASEAARAYADHYQVSLGISAGWAYAGAPEGSAWYVHHLPLKAHRFGLDARMEAVEPTPQKSSGDRFSAPTSKE